MLLAVPWKICWSRTFLWTRLGVRDGASCGTGSRCDSVIDSTSSRFTALLRFSVRLCSNFSVRL